MDIRAWLQNTEDREPPDEEPRASFVEDPPRLSEPVRNGHRRKRKHASRHPRVERKDSRRDESRRPNSRVAPPPSSSDHVRVLQAAAEGLHSDRSSHHSRNSSRSRIRSRSSVSARQYRPVRTYERRARHKTRPDTYDAKPKKHGKLQHEYRDHREGKSKSKRRKSHRSRDGARSTGLVQNFQLKNGPKNDRLTLRPDVSAGLFKHGRASAATAATGPGLPDLVFNEMKFLSRPKEHQDKVPVDEAARQKSKKTRKELREEEISTYFQRASADQEAIDGINHHRQGTLSLRPSMDAHDHQREASIGKETAASEPAVEDPAKALQGVANRGHQREHGDDRTTSKSCYTWSESIPRRSPNTLQQQDNLPPQSEAPSVLRAHQQPSRPSSISGKEKQRLLSHSADNHRRSLFPQEERDRGRFIRSSHGQDMVPVKMYRVSAEQIAQQSPARPYLESALGSAQRKPGTAQRSHSDRRTPASCYEEAGRTSDILKLGPQHRHLRSSSLRARRPIEQDKENIRPTQSTPTSQLLRNAFEAVAMPQGVGTRARQTESRPQGTDGILVQLHSDARKSGVAQVQVDPAVYVNEHGEPLEWTRNVHETSSWGRGSSARSARPEALQPTSTRLAPIEQRLTAGSSARLADTLNRSRQGSLRMGRPYWGHDRGADVNENRNTEGSVYDDELDQFPDLPDVALNAPELLNDFTRYARDSIQQALYEDAPMEHEYISPEGYYCHDETMAEGTEVAPSMGAPSFDAEPSVNNGVDALAGFWRPNVLY